MTRLEAFQADLQRRLGRKVTVVLVDHASWIIFTAEDLGHHAISFSSYVQAADPARLLEEAAAIFERRKP